VLGGGPGGMAAALSAASRGLDVVLVDAGNFLGYGLHGAYKSKALWEAAMDWIGAEGLGWVCLPNLKKTLFGEVHARVEKGMAELTDMYFKYMRLKKVRFIRGFGVFTGPRSMAVEGQNIEFQYAVIATGSRPRSLPGLNVDGRRVMTSDHVVDAEANFKSLIIVGAGVLGCEFASIFSAFGVEVVLIDRAERLMGHEDPDVSSLLADLYCRNGVDVRSAARVKRMDLSEAAVRTELEDGSVILTERALISIGRTPCSRSLNLEAAGVETDAWGFIRVNDGLETNVEHIYAVGDVGQRNTPLDLALVQVAEAEGRMAVKHICGEAINIHPEHIPFIVFTMPMVAGAGLNEVQARQRYGAVRVAKFLNIRNHRYHAMQSHEGFVKLIVGPPGNDRLIGVRAIGAGADNVIGEVSVLIDNNVPYTYLLDCVHAHPSLAESLQNAARVLAGVLPPEI
jgi:dihydrolipoamide dehydrogenase